jgi:hypothetical protein
MSEPFSPEQAEHRSEVPAQPVSASTHVAAMPAQSGPRHAQPKKSNVKQARDRAQYVRQQKGHSFILHWFVLGIFSIFIVPIYYSVSPNHFWKL